MTNLDAFVVSGSDDKINKLKNIRDGQIQKKN